jgi:hypothetical protein
MVELASFNACADGKSSIFDRLFSGVNVDVKAVSKVIKIVGVVCSADPSPPAKNPALNLLRADVTITRYVSNRRATPHKR